MRLRFFFSNLKYTHFPRLHHAVLGIFCLLLNLAPAYVSACNSTTTPLPLDTSSTSDDEPILAHYRLWLPILTATTQSLLDLAVDPSVTAQQTLPPALHKTWEKLQRDLEKQPSPPKNHTLHNPLHNAWITLFHQLAQAQSFGDVLEPLQTFARAWHAWLACASSIPHLEDPRRALQTSIAALEQRLELMRTPPPRIPSQARLLHEKYPPYRSRIRISWPNLSASYRGPIQIWRHAHNQDPQSIPPPPRMLLAKLPHSTRAFEDLTFFGQDVFPTYQVIGTNAFGVPSKAGYCQIKTADNPNPAPSILQLRHPLCSPFHPHFYSCAGMVLLKLYTPIPQNLIRLDAASHQLQQKWAYAPTPLPLEARDYPALQQLKKGVCYRWETTQQAVCIAQDHHEPYQLAAAGAENLFVPLLFEYQLLQENSHTTQLTQTPSLNEKRAFWQSRPLNQRQAWYETFWQTATPTEKEHWLAQTFKTRIQHHPIIMLGALAENYPHIHTEMQDFWNALGRHQRHRHWQAITRQWRQKLGATQPFMQHWWPHAKCHEQWAQWQAYWTSRDDLQQQTLQQQWQTLPPQHQLQSLKQWLSTQPEGIWRLLLWPDWSLLNPQESRQFLFSGYRHLPQHFNAQVAAFAQWTQLPTTEKIDWVKKFTPPTAYWRAQFRYFIRPLDVACSFYLNEIIAVSAWLLTCLAGLLLLRERFIKPPP